MNDPSPKPKLGKPHNVRLDSATERRIKALSKKLGVPVSLLVRNAVSNRLPQWEAAGVQLVEITN